MYEKSCCFIGHREIKIDESLIHSIKNIIYKLISEENVTVFFFGSKSKFNSLCYDIVSDFKSSYPNIKRVYIRAEYEIVNNCYKTNLMDLYEDSFFPEPVKNAGKLSYLKRNEVMIKKSDYCVFYYDKSYQPKTKYNQKNFISAKSGTMSAYQFSIKSNKKIINVFEQKKQFHR